MLYYLINQFFKDSDIPGLGMFDFITFRAVMAIVFSLIIAMIIGSYIINFLRRKQIGEQIRNLGLEGQMAKKGTPTMGGIIIIASMIVPTLLFADLSNIYVVILLLTTITLGTIGFIDDYIKVFKKNKEGLSGRFKVVGQVLVGLLVGSAMWFNATVVTNADYKRDIRTGVETNLSNEEVIAPVSTIPFLKDHEFDYRSFFFFLEEGSVKDTLGWVLYVAVAIFIVTAVSNGANLTDGIDGLAAGVSAVMVATLVVFAYLSGNIIYSSYFDIMYIPNAGEMVVFGMAFLGSLVGFLWYNGYPAQVFMGDTGSLMIGGVIAVFALLVRKELLLPLLCGVFVVENLSVIMQVSYFKYTKKKYGEGRRILLMSPLHHHYQKKNIPENKIVLRFWIVQLTLAAITIATLKIR